MRAALDQCKSVLAERALTEAQRARLLTLQADALIRNNQPLDGLKVLQELTSLHPKQADPVQIALLTGQAKLRIGR